MATNPWATLDDAGEVVRPAPGQFRAARGMLGWSLVQASQRARVSIASVRVSEREDGGPMPADALANLRSAYEADGITFHDDAAGNGPGVRLALKDR